MSTHARSPCRVSVCFDRLEARYFFSTYDISGVQAAALDQPQVYAIFRNSPTGNPLGGNAPDDGYAVKAFLDTGASGILLSKEAAASDALNLTRATFNGQKVQFEDIGVAGGDFFDVSTAIYGALAGTTGLGQSDIPVEDFSQTFGPTRVQINQNDADPFFGDELNVIGMPGMVGKVAVMDPTPLNATDPFDLDAMHTFIYSPGTPYNPAAKDTNPGIPATNRHVKLSYGNFAKYTTVTPSGATGPTLASNPFIGPNPVRAAGTVDTTPKIHLTEGSQSADGSFLLDTGAAASFISQNIASKLGVHYRAGTYGGDNPELLDANGNHVANQFTIPIGGIGGAINVAGFFTDSMAIPTTEGESIRFLQAPLLVLDITVEDPSTHAKITLDGDLGMNFLVASIAVDGTTLGDGAAGAFDWITFDQPKGILGLNLPDLPPAPPPPVTNATLKGTIFKDTNANGVRDSGEAAASGWTVWLDLNGNGTKDSTDKSATTDASGNYTFTGLTPKSYTARAVAQSGWRQTLPSGGKAIAVTLTSGQVLGGQNFAFTQRASVSGVVFNDTSRNGVKESSEVGLSAWKVYIDGNNNGKWDTGERFVMSSSTSGSVGAWSFNDLVAGKKYIIRVSQQTGWTRTAPSTGSFTPTPTSGQVLTGKNFGERK
jgi:hypothetical protein